MENKKRRRGRKRFDFYVLRVGLKPGVYKSYDEALSEKYPSDDWPLVKGFYSKEEAEHYLETGVEMSEAVAKAAPTHRALF